MGLPRSRDRRVYLSCHCKIGEQSNEKKAGPNPAFFWKRTQSRITFSRLSQRGPSLSWHELHLSAHVLLLVRHVPHLSPHAPSLFRRGPLMHENHESRDHYVSRPQH